MSKTKIFSIARNNEPPCIRLKSFRNQKDGTTKVKIEYDEEFLAVAKKELNVETVSSEEMGAYVQTLISKAVNGIDGYKVIPG